MLRRAGMLLMLLTLAPGLCLALPAGQSVSPASPVTLTGQPHAGHGASCAPEACCAMVAKVATKKADNLGHRVAGAPLPFWSAAETSTRPVALIDPLATLVDPPERNLPLIC